MTCPNCKKPLTPSEKFGWTYTCAQCGNKAEAPLSGGQWVQGCALGCGKTAQLVFGAFLVVGGVPVLFTPGFAGGILMILLGGAMALSALHDLFVG
ncbi:MAG: hypothetical protein L6Q31_02970 [Fimbriimonadaceae bacterium]|nr:hypothetical protein [Fimbriimonadaceae bacterium]NUM38807.1 hypothetical protein [Armatimonadota bacterium]